MHPIVGPLLSLSEAAFNYFSSPLQWAWSEGNLMTVYTAMADWSSRFSLPAGHAHVCVEGFFWSVRRTLKASSDNLRYHKKTATGRQDNVVNEGDF
jgi:hypothetical protein